jgi:hypothetical protein
LLAEVAGLLVVVWFLTDNVYRAVTLGAGVVLVCGATLALTTLLPHLPGARFHVPSATDASRLAAIYPPALHLRSPAFRRILRLDPGAMTNELGRPAIPGLPDVHHSLIGSSGRLEAWVGAIHAADARPLLGYGFGTEDRVFVDRYYSFEGARPENSWLGIYIDVGIAGVLLLAAALASTALSGVRTLRSLPRQRRIASAAVAGVFASGLVEMLVQSFAVSVGDIAMLSFWICGALLATSPGWTAAPEADL